MWCSLDVNCVLELKSIACCAYDGGGTLQQRIYFTSFKLFGSSKCRMLSGEMLSKKLSKDCSERLLVTTFT